MSTRPYAAALLLIFALAPASALAAPGSTEADKASARTLTRDGYTALEKKDFAKALELFTRAEALYHAPSVLLGLARVQAELGQLVVARATYDRLLAEPLPPRSLPVIVKVYEDARAELAALTARIPSVTFVVKGATSARITFDDVEIPPADLATKREVDPGKHHAHAEAAGSSPAEAEVTLAEGQSETITLALKPIPAPEPVAPPPWWTTRRKIGVGLGAGGVVMIGAGVAVGVAALGKRSALAEACPTADTCPASQQGTIDSYHALGTVSPVLLIVGAVATCAGAFFFFTAKTAKPAERATISPTIGAGYLGVEGSF
ncbi:MAG: hypothetical protein ABI134_26150 [Byssovorax sp.]